MEMSNMTAVGITLIYIIGFFYGTVMMVGITIPHLLRAITMIIGVIMGIILIIEGEKEDNETKM